jgi:hypothetical protein
MLPGAFGLCCSLVKHVDDSLAIDSLQIFLLELADVLVRNCEQPSEARVLQLPKKEGILNVRRREWLSRAALISCRSAGSKKL